LRSHSLIPMIPRARISLMKTLSIPTSIDYYPHQYTLLKIYSLCGQAIPYPAQ
jgi:hypothetical protein